ncbi:putative sulfate exporter family transporter [Streptococcus equi]
MAIFHQLKLLSNSLSFMAMAAIGLNTNLVTLVKTGGKAILLGGFAG